MNESKIETLRSSWSKVTPLGDSAASLFYDRLFEIDPEVKSLFSTADLPDQYGKLLQAIGFVVHNAHKPDSLLPVLTDLGRRHATYGVKDAHYETVGAALLWTLEQGLQDEWSDEIREAWLEAYEMVTSIMKHAANDPISNTYSTVG